jgi:hypothetical protein
MPTTPRKKFTVARLGDLLDRSLSVLSWRGVGKETGMEDLQNVTRLDNQTPSSPDCARGCEGKILCEGELFCWTCQIGDAC